jgi:hypothetical protein
LTEPPVATRGRPFIIFFERSSEGSSQLPAIEAEAEKSRTFCGPAIVQEAAAALGIIDGRVVGVCAIFKDRKAPSRHEEVVERMVVGVGCWKGFNQVKTQDSIFNCPDGNLKLSELFDVESSFRPSNDDSALIGQTLWDKS